MVTRRQMLKLSGMAVRDLSRNTEDSSDARKIPLLHGIAALIVLPAEALRGERRGTDESKRLRTLPFRRDAARRLCSSGYRSNTRNW